MSDEIVKGVGSKEFYESWLDLPRDRNGVDRYFLVRWFKELAEKCAKAVLEEFIDDHFPENSLDCKTRVSAKLDSLKEGESWSFYATKKSDMSNIGINDLIGIAMADTTSDIESIMAKSADKKYTYPRECINSFETISREGNVDEVSSAETEDKTCNQKVSRETPPKEVPSEVPPKHEYKVGDKVEIIGKSPIKQGFIQYKHAFSVGDVATIVRLPSTADSTLYTLFGQSSYWGSTAQLVNEKDFILAKEPVITTYKIGDSVRIVKSGDHDLKLNSVAEIIDISGTYYVLRGESELGLILTMDVLKEDFIPAENNIFKVGDKVYALIDSEIKKCRISEIDGSNLPIMLIDEDDNIEWFAPEEVYYTINELLDHLREKAKDL